MDDFIGSIMAIPHLVCHYIDCGQPEVENYCTDVFNVPLNTQYRQVPSPFFVGLAMF
jgi:hypothetical protein